MLLGLSLLGTSLSFFPLDNLKQIQGPNTTSATPELLSAGDTLRMVAGPSLEMGLLFDQYGLLQLRGKPRLQQCCFATSCCFTGFLVYLPLKGCWCNNPLKEDLWSH